VARDTFPRPPIAERLRRFVLVKLYINDRKPESQSPRWRKMLEERFGTSAIPLYVTLSPKDEVLGRLDFPGGSMDRFAEAMAALLDAALAK